MRSLVLGVVLATAGVALCDDYTGTFTGDGITLSWKQSGASYEGYIDYQNSRYTCRAKAEADGKVLGTFASGGESFEFVVVGVGSKSLNLQSAGNTFSLKKIETTRNPLALKAVRGEGVSSTPVKREVEVNGNHREWTDTGIDVPSGSLVTFQATGRVLWDRKVPEPEVGPGGASWKPRSLQGSSMFVLPDAPCASLIGAIGHTPFPIGTGAKVRARAGGRLYLSINERWCPECWEDNAGKFSVSISIEPVSVTAEPTEAAEVGPPRPGDHSSGPHSALPLLVPIPLAVEEGVGVAAQPD